MAGFPGEPVEVDLGIGQLDSNRHAHQSSTYPAGSPVMMQTTLIHGCGSVVIVS